MKRCGVMLWTFLLPMALCHNISKQQPNVWKWNKSKNTFVNLNGQVLVNNVKLETSFNSIKGVNVQVVAHNMDPYILSQPNSSFISGFLGDMWNILEEVLQFKSNITSVKIFRDGREMIKSNLADIYLAALVYTSKTTNMYFSQPYFRNWYHLYFRLPEGKPSIYLHFEAFSYQLWASLMLFFTLMTIMLWKTCCVLQKFVPKVEKLLSLPTYFMGVIAAFLNTGYDLKLRSCTARLQIFLALFFGVLCYYALSASLVANLAVLDRPLPFTNLEGIAHQNIYSMCMRNITFVYDNFTDANHTILPQWQRIINNKKCPQNIINWKTIPPAICQPNIVILENQIVMGLALQHVQCQVTLLSPRLFVTNNYIAISTRFHEMKSISIMMLRIRSTGIAQKLIKKWVKTELPNFFTKTTANQITFSHIKGLLAIYLGLIGVALAILALELCWVKMFKQKKPILTCNTYNVWYYQ